MSRRFTGTGNFFRFAFILGKYLLIAVFIVMQLFCHQQNIVAQDTIPVVKTEKKQFKAEPFRATMLAIALPGLGQIYNKKYWKVPIVYAGFAGLIYAIDFNTKEYTKFMRAYQDFTDRIPETDSYLELIRNVDPSTYDPVLYPDTYDPSAAAWYKERMLRMIDYYKKYRDLSYIGIAAWYLVTILDANVDASLFNYDITNNLDLTIAPMQVPLIEHSGLGLSVSLRVTF
ncbi:MAG: DUF5683 domain-containing protein [Bacteroidia bacterium]|nr:DUF5683 domain-containing protein [Bacteroidia bacterium]